MATWASDEQGCVHVQKITELSSQFSNNLLQIYYNSTSGLVYQIHNNNACMFDPSDLVSSNWLNEFDQYLMFISSSDLKEQHIDWDPVS